MIDRRAAIRAAVAALPAAWLALSSPAAAQDFQKLTPFLVDLPGWTGKKADGMAMQMPGMNMTTATRDYTRGDAKVSASVISGSTAQGMMAAVQSGVKIETAEMHMSTTTVDGLMVARTFNVAEKAGAVMVVLGQSALFNLTFTGVAEDEAYSLARRFDWKAIQAALPK
jgi:hypothetical protein